MPMVVMTAPTNIWTREEFDAWVGDNVKDALAQRHPSAPPVTEEDIHEMMQAMVMEINYGIVPAGNA